MNRRIFLLTALVAPVAARAEGEPWQARLLLGQFDGTAWRAGLHVMLLPGWKTYWRVPGASGIAPAIEIKGENLKASNILYPMPQRLKAGEDDVIGYKDEVVFPLLLEPQDLARPINLSLKSFLGVCDEVCIPVQFEATATLKPAGSAAADDAMLATWMARLPQTVTDVVSTAVATMEQGKPSVKLTLARPVQDIFAEGKATHYFHAPQFTGSDAVLSVSGAESADELRDQTIRLTMTTQQGGVEQMVSIV
jgi:DsbC/DsbD-like thiol-disulfide interchange protein